MVDATRARLGERETAAAPDLFVHGTVSAERGVFVVSFVVKDAAGADVGERELRVQGRDCRAIEEPAALVLATMISVVRPSTETSPPPSQDERPATRGEDGRQEEHAVPAPSPSSRTTESPPPRPPHVPREEPPLPTRRALDAVAVASAGVLPSAGFGAGLRSSYFHRSRILLALEMSFEAGASVRAGRGEVAFQLSSAAVLAGFPVLRSAKLELIPVLAFRGGVLRTVPSGFQLVKAAAHPMALAGAGALLRASLAPHVHVELLPQAEVALVRDVFEATEGKRTFVLHQPSALGARLSVGIGYEFP